MTRRLVASCIETPRHASTARTIFASPSSAGQESTGFDTTLKNASLNRRALPARSRLRAENEGSTVHDSDGIDSFEELSVNRFPFKGGGCGVGGESRSLRIEMADEVNQPIAVDVLAV